jgi:hypothetical protein
MAAMASKSAFVAEENYTCIAGPNARSAGSGFQDGNGHFKVETGGLRTLDTDFVSLYN